MSSLDKYDVVHRVKKKRSTILGGRSRRGTRDGAKTPISTPALADDIAGGSVSDPEIISGTSKPGDDDTLSIISSVGTISTLDDFEQLERTDLDKGDLTSLGLPSPPKKGAETHLDAVRNAQVRFLTLVKTNSATAAMQYARKRSSSTAPLSAPPLKTMFTNPRPILQTSQSALVVPMTRSTSAPLGISKSALASTAEKNEGIADNDGDEEKGVLRSLKHKVESFVPVVEPVFDSSSKQRVQSYTGSSPSSSTFHPFCKAHRILFPIDRILFKSTVEPPDEEESEEEELEPPVPASRSLHPSRSSAFVSALRDLAHPHPNLDGSRIDEGSRSRRGSTDDRHLRFGELFTRPRRKSVSSDPIADDTSEHTMPRTKSLQPDQLRRHLSSGAVSNKTDDTESNRKKTFWRRVASFPALTSSASSPTSPGSPSTPRISSALASPALSSSANSPTLPPPASRREPSYFPPDVHQNGSTPSTPSRRLPRKIFTLSSDSPPSSPEETRQHTVNFAASPSPIASPPLPRANSEEAVSSSFSPPPTQRSSSTNVGFPRYATTSATHRPIRDSATAPMPYASSSASLSPPILTATAPPSSHVAQSSNSASLNNRLKSFLNSIPLPFLSAPATSRAVSQPIVRRKKRGPKPGEIEVLRYDSVNDLAKMGAVSDHRPVFLVAAIGVAEQDTMDEI